MQRLGLGGRVSDSGKVAAQCGCLMLTSCAKGNKKSVGTLPCRSGLSGRRIAAMVDNDNACEPDKRGVLESIASKLAPTVPRDCVKNQKKGPHA